MFAVYLVQIKEQCTHVVLESCHGYCMIRVLKTSSFLWWRERTLGGHEHQDSFAPSLFGQQLDALSSLPPWPPAAVHGDESNEESPDRFPVAAPPPWPCGKSYYPQSAARKRRCRPRGAPSLAELWRLAAWAPVRRPCRSSRPPWRASEARVVPASSMAALAVAPPPFFARYCRAGR